MNLLEQAISVIKVFAASVKEGKFLAESEKIESRIKICLDCKYLKKTKRGNDFVCVKCGCSFKKKVTFESASCPLKKW